MIYLLFVLLFVLLINRLKQKVLFHHVPIKYAWIYDEIFATRGIISNSQPNTKNAFKDIAKTAYKKNDSIHQFGILLNIRLTKDEKFICFSDQYLKRLTGVPGSVSRKTLVQIKQCRILGEDRHCDCILTVTEALEMIDKSTPILLELNCHVTFKQVQQLVDLVKERIGSILVVCGPISSYQVFRHCKIDIPVLWKYNPFRKRLNIITQKAYKGMTLPNYCDIVKELRKDDFYVKVKLPSAQDIIFSMIDNNNIVNSIVKEIWSISNQYNTRLKVDHPLLNMKIAHRGIYSTKYLENSVQAIEECIENGVAIESDFFWYRFATLKDVKSALFNFLKQKNKSSLGVLYQLIKEFILETGEVRVGHQGDKASESFGQPKSLVGKVAKEDSITFEEFLERVKGRVPIILDVKDFHVFSRRLIKKMIVSLQDYHGDYVVQSFNPLLMRWLYHHEPAIIRGQVGHSLRGLYDKIPIWVFWAINFFLFYSGKPDYVVYDLDKNVHILSRFNNILGLPVLGYAPTSYVQILPFKDEFQNFICENLADKEAWRGYQE